MSNFINNLKLKIEVKSYNKYLKLNRTRKAAEAAGTTSTPVTKIFDKLDEVRRTIGYVK